MSAELVLKSKLINTIFLLGLNLIYEIKLYNNSTSEEDSRLFEKEISCSGDGYCNYKGVCNHGQCLCLPGYFGNECQCNFSLSISYSRNVLFAKVHTIENK